MFKSAVSPPRNYAAVVFVIKGWVFKPSMRSHRKRQSNKLNSDGITTSKGVLPFNGSGRLLISTSQNKRFIQSQLQILIQGSVFIQEFRPRGSGFLKNV